MKNIKEIIKENKKKIIIVVSSFSLISVLGVSLYLHSSGLNEVKNTNIVKEDTKKIKNNEKIKEETKDKKVEETKDNLDISIKEETKEKTKEETKKETITPKKEEVKKEVKKVSNTVAPKETKKEEKKEITTPKKVVNTTPKKEEVKKEEPKKEILFDSSKAKKTAEIGSVRFETIGNTEYAYITVADGYEKMYIVGLENGGKAFNSANEALDWGGEYLINDETNKYSSFEVGEHYYNGKIVWVVKFWE